MAARPSQRTDYRPPANNSADDLRCGLLPPPPEIISSEHTEQRYLEKIGDWNYFQSLPMRLSAELSNNGSSLIIGISFSLNDPRSTTISTGLHLSNVYLGLRYSTTPDGQSGAIEIQFDPQRRAPPPPFLEAHVTEYLKRVDRTFSFVEQETYAIMNDASLSAEQKALRLLAIAGIASAQTAEEIARIGLAERTHPELAAKYRDQLIKLLDEAGSIASLYRSLSELAAENPHSDEVQSAYLAFLELYGEHGYDATGWLTSHQRFVA